MTSPGNYTHKVTCGGVSWLCFVDEDGYLGIRHPNLGDFGCKAIGGSIGSHFHSEAFLVEKLNKFKGNK